MTRSEIEKIADGFVGVPYKTAGRDKSGMDCLGLMMAMLGACGLVVPDPLTTDPEQVFGRLCHHFRLLEGEPPRDLDVAETNDEKHVGVIVGRKILHISERTGALMTPLYTSQGARFFRHIGAAA